MLWIRGAYCERGGLLLPFIDCEPNVDMPATLFLLKLDGDSGKECRLLRFLCCWDCELLDSLSCMFRAGSDCWAKDGGVTEPLEGAVPLLVAPSLEVSVE